MQTPTARLRFPRSSAWRSALALFALVAALGLAAAPALAADPVNKSFIGDVAIHGYDPVAYFEMGKPVEGKKAFTVEWKDANWRFASAANRDKFKADPEKYAPQYGGYCAYAVSQGGTADIDPDAWSIVEGKLYLNLSPDIKKIWEKDIPGYIAKANENWPEISGEK